MPVLSDKYIVLLAPSGWLLSTTGMLFCFSVRTDCRKCSNFVAAPVKLSSWMVVIVVSCSYSQVLLLLITLGQIINLNIQSAEIQC